MANINVVLKPKQGIKVDSSNKYLYDPTLVQRYVDASKEYSEQAMMSEANAKASEINADMSAKECKESEENARKSEINAKDSENNTQNYELSAKRYKEQAREYAEQASQSQPSNVQQIVNENVGRLNQIGYYGTLIGDTLAFEKPVGEEEYELKKGFTYLVDLQFEAVGELDDSVKIVIKNNDDNVNIVNIIHSNPDEPVTVGELKQIMRYNTVSGWRWIFNAWYTETQGGSRVLVMPSTVVADGGGSGGTVDIDVDGVMSDTSENPVQNKVIKNYIDTTKQDTLISGTNIKTINGENIIGSGDIEIKLSGSGHNVGDIFYTTRLDTELNGAVECDGNIYNVDDFTGEETIANLLTQHKIQYVDFATYASILTAKGSCEYFGWENGNNFRVPTLPCVILSGNQSPVVGNGMALGLTDGSKNGGFTSGSSLTQSATGNVTNFGKPVGTTPTSSTAANKLATNTAIGVTTDPNYSGLIVDLDYLGLEYKAMVQLATGATDEALITATTVLQTLANKADKDAVADINLNNISTEAKNFITGAIAPSDKFVSLTLGANASKYEAPANGWFNLEKEASAPGQYITLFNNATRQGMRAYQAGDTCSASLCVKKGESVTVYYDCAGDITIFSFTYAEGDNN